MSSKLKIGFLAAFVIIGFILAYQQKVSWTEFIGSLVVLNTGILAFEESIRKSKEAKLKEEAKQETLEELKK